MVEYNLLDDNGRCFTLDYNTIWLLESDRSMSLKGKIAIMSDYADHNFLNRAIIISSRYVDVKIEYDHVYTNSYIITGICRSDDPEGQNVKCYCGSPEDVLKCAKDVFGILHEKYHCPKSDNHYSVELRIYTTRNHNEEANSYFMSEDPI